MSSIQGSVSTEVFQYFNNRNRRGSDYSLSNSPGFREVQTNRRKHPLNLWAQIWYLFFNIIESKDSRFISELKTIEFFLRFKWPSSSQ